MSYEVILQNSCIPLAVDSGSPQNHDDAKNDAEEYMPERVVDPHLLPVLTCVAKTPHNNISQAQNVTLNDLLLIQQFYYVIRKIPAR